MAVAAYRAAQPEGATLLRIAAGTGAIENAGCPAMAAARVADRRRRVSPAPPAML
ncbi:hypothetical protein D3C76_1016150 [compost metagenome]